MADDGQARARIEQHQRRDAAGMRSLAGMVDVLAADGEARNRPRRPLNQDRRHAQGDVDVWIIPRLRRDRADLVEVGRQPVHLPIAGDELPERHIVPLVPPPFRRP